jgi:prophage antirepressor-like protein
MSALAKITNQFEGKSITTLEYDGRPCWIAREIGAAMGYVQNGKRLVDRVRSDWSADFIKDRDYTILHGQNLKDFAKLIHDGTESVPRRSHLGTDPVPSHSKHLMLLFESGIHLACLRTNKPIGRRLRRFIVDKILPDIVRTGTYRAEKPPKSNSDGQSRVLHAEALRDREARLLAKEDAMVGKRRADSLKQMAMFLATKQMIDDAQQSILMVLATEIETGINFSHLRKQIQDDEIRRRKGASSVGPPLGASAEDRASWLTPASIAVRTGASLAKVGRAIAELGLRGDFPGLSYGCEAQMPTGQTMIVYRYSPRAVEMIKKKMQAQSRCLL